MTDLNQTILQKASGETRFDPDQQKHYLGTFKERLVLTVDLTDAHLPQVKDGLQTILQEKLKEIQPLILKISSQLDSTSQLYYMKLGQDLNLTSSLIDQGETVSLYGLVLHTDHAINLDETSLRETYPDLFQEKISQPEKTSFWQKLFRKS